MLVPCSCATATSLTPTYDKLDLGASDTLLIEGDSTVNSTPATGLYAFWDTTFQTRIIAAAPGITLVNGGVNGDTVAGVLARIVANLTACNATKLVIGIGSNDVFGGTAPATYGTRYRTMLANALSYGLSPEDIICLEVYFRGDEAWDTGPVYTSAFEATTIALNAEGQAACEFYGVKWAPWRQQLIWASVEYNRSKAHTGVLTLDGTHFITPGKDVAGNIFYNTYVNVV